MMNLVNYLFSFTICFSLILSPCAYAGEIVPAGTELSEESYVFTIEEATDLMERLQELEQKEKELQKYKELEQVRLQQIDLFEMNEEFYIIQLDRYKEIDLTNQKIIEKYRRRDKFNSLERTGLFLLGAGLAFGSISAANAIVANQNAAFANF